MYWPWRSEPGIPKYGDLLVTIVGLQTPGLNKAADARDLAALISKEVDSLSSRVKQAISLRYGFNETGESLTLAEAGKRMEVTKERVRQLEARGLRQLRRTLIRGRLLSKEFA